jgi:hypothetical protein
MLPMLQTQPQQQQAQQHQAASGHRCQLHSQHPTPNASMPQAIQQQQHLAAETQQQQEDMGLLCRGLLQMRAGMLSRRAGHCGASCVTLR